MGAASVAAASGPRTSAPSSAASSRTVTGIIGCHARSELSARSSAACSSAQTSRMASSSAKGRTWPATSWPRSCPLPSTATMSSGPDADRAAAIASRRFPPSTTVTARPLRSASARAPASTWARIAAGSSLRGLSSVTTTRSAAAAAAAPIGARFSGSRSPPQPSTTMRRWPDRPASTALTAWGVCAKSTNTVAAPSPRSMRCIRPGTTASANPEAARSRSTPTRSAMASAVSALRTLNSPGRPRVNRTGPCGVDAVTAVRPCPASARSRAA